MRTRIKICGIKTPEALLAVLDSGADACGLNFFPKSPRAIGLEAARGLAARAPHLLKVGLFVDADNALIDSAVSAGALGALQLQGTEGPARVAELKARFQLPVWKAVGVKAAADVATAARDFAGADLLLLDAKPPEGSVLTGGNGLRFDWRILDGNRPARPWGLAGGLTPQTVAEAIRRTGAPLVDVASGVESAPGVKDVAKIAAFVDSARRA
ncbi:MAG: phosphoribosylanthranilate isomerase [Sphingomonas sp.]|nr:MAG: phosphoribosylanthranilate isomerase [Sphingomonas sp.]